MLGYCYIHRLGGGIMEKLSLIILQISFVIGFISTAIFNTHDTTMLSVEMIGMVCCGIALRQMKSQEDK